MSTQQLTREEIERVFAMHWGCMCISYNGLSIVPVEATLMYNMKHDGDDIGERKLLLTPLNLISDEDAIHIYDMFARRYHLNESKIMAGKELITGFLNRTTNLSPNECFSLFQYLISKGYAVPLWFGVNHPLNGKNAIELNIGIEKL